MKEDDDNDAAAVVEGMVEAVGMIGRMEGIARRRHLHR